MLQSVFTVLLVLGFLMNGFHDLVDIPGWTHGRQVRAAFGVNKLIVGTAANSLAPGVAAALALYYWHTPAPGGVRTFWLIYSVVVVLAAVLRLRP